jgi:aminoglycoside phosphotransferase (APT) family kinase protein
VLHGDYKLRHVWADRGSIQVFDFGNVHAGDCYADVASFLVELSVLRLGSPSFDSKKIDRYSEAVLSGYFTTERPPLLGFYTVEALLKKWMRRLRSWSRTAMVSRLQMGARRVGAAPLVERLYLDRWFMARVRESLDAGVAQDMESSGELRG